MTASLDAALTYASRGWRVCPIRPGTKHPAIERWQDVATCDAELIRQWFTAWPNHGVGLATGERSGIFVLDVDTAEGKVGHESLMALEAHYGALPATVEALTPTGGRHLYYRHPAGLELNNSAGRLGPDLDIRANGGQVLAAPSIHPVTGTAYAWDLEHHPADVEVADAPAWLIDLLKSQPKVEVDRSGPRPTYEQATLARDRFDLHPEAADRIAAMLTAHGWAEGRQGRDGVRYFTRPGKRDGISATLGKVAPGVLYVFTGSTEFEAERAYDASQVLAVLEHGGDRQAVDQRLVDAGYGVSGYGTDLTVLGAAQAPTTPLIDVDTAVGGSWARSPLADVVHGIQTGAVNLATPTLGVREDGIALFYPGRVNGLYGEPGKGKTWIALAVVAEQLAAGHAVAWIDLEEPAHGIVARLLALGVPAQTIVERFAHFAPEEPIRNAHGLAQVLADLAPALAVIDSTGEALAVEGLGPNNDDEVARWFQTWPRWIATHTGAGVIVIDHVVKDETTRGLWPGGSQRKKAAINGSAFMAATIAELGRGVEGRLKLTTSKDRQGHHRPGKRAGQFVLDARDPDHIRWAVEAPEAESGDEGFKPTVYMHRVAEYLAEQTDTVSKEQIRKGVTGKNGHIDDALAHLVQSGHVVAAVVDRYTRYELRRPYPDPTPELTVIEGPSW